MDSVQLGLVGIFTIIFGLLMIWSIDYVRFVINVNDKIPVEKKSKYKRIATVLLVMGYILLVVVVASSFENGYQQNEVLKTALEENPYTIINLTVEDKAIETYASPSLFSDEQPRDHYLVKFTNGDIISVNIFDYRKLEPGKTYALYYKNFISGDEIVSNLDCLGFKSSYERFEEVNFSGY